MRWQSQKNQRERAWEWERMTERQREWEREERRELSLSCQGQSISNVTIRITTRGRATPPCSWAAPNQMLSWRNKNTHRLKTEDRRQIWRLYMWRASKVLSLLFQFLACDECADFCAAWTPGGKGVGEAGGRQRRDGSLELVGRAESEIATWQQLMQRPRCFLMRRHPLPPFAALPSFPLCQALRRLWPRPPGKQVATYMRFIFDWYLRNCQPRRLIEGLLCPCPALLSLSLSSALALSLPPTLPPAFFHSALAG